jgi:zinc carboxypeptidase
MGTMLAIRFAAAALLSASSLAAQAPRAALPLTRPERTAFRETSRYDDVAAFLSQVARANPRVLRLTTMGFTTEGRTIPLVVAGRVADAGPAAVRRSGRTVIYIQADIHAGEVEGKEAALMVLRDLAAGRHTRWLDSLVILVAPIYNADGNERVTLTSRPLQNGPIGGAGQRANAQGLDLNRDHTKLETPEARSQADLWRRYDPHAAIDLHTTDGSIHGYLLTYAEPLHPATDSAIRRFVRDEWLPAVTRAVKAHDGLDLFFYGNTPDEPVDRGGGGAEQGWYTFDARPRFSENYWGLRNRLGILGEAYSYASFEARIHATYRFLVETLDFAWAHAGRMRALTAAADARSLVGDSLPVRARIHRGDTVTILLGDVREEANPYTGQRMLVRQDSTRPVRMPEFTTFEATEWSRVPRAYLVPAGLSAVLDRLAAHGVTTRPLAAPAVIALERFRIDSTWTSPREFQGHHERTVQGGWESVTDTVPAGTVVVPMDQPLARLAFVLLEPRSDDGVLDWNLVDDALAGARYYPIRRTFAAF